MTIIQPNKYKDIKRTAFWLGMVLVGMVFMWVFVYLQTVNLEHNIARAKNDLEELKVNNAEMKDAYYNLVDADNLELLAGERGLVKDANPQWAFVSQSSL